MAESSVVGMTSHLLRPSHKFPAPSQQHPQGLSAQDKKNAGTDWSPRLHKPTSTSGLDFLKSLDGRGRCGGRRLRYVGFGEAVSGRVSVVLELAPELHAIEHGAQDVDGKPIDQ